MCNKQSEHAKEHLSQRIRGIQPVVQRRLGPRSSLATQELSENVNDECIVPAKVSQPKAPFTSVLCKAMDILSKPGEVPLFQRFDQMTPAAMALLADSTIVVLAERGFQPNRLSALFDVKTCFLPRSGATNFI